LLTDKQKNKQNNRKITLYHSRATVLSFCCSVIGDKPFLWSKPKFDPP